MADTPRLSAEKRLETGTAACRRLRRRGLIPGNVYGHKTAPIAISVPEDVLDALVHGGQKVLDLEIAGDTDKAMFREVQWDVWGSHIQHFDLVRVSVDERVTVDIPVELKGTAAGVLDGGMLGQPLHTLSVDCLAFDIPESLVVRIGTLEIGDAVQVRDVELPPGLTVHNPPEAVVVHVVAPKADIEEEESAIAPAEPEVIARKDEETAAES